MGNDSTLISMLLAKLSAAFKICDLGAPGFFLSIETVRLDGGLLLSHRCYMEDILNRASIVDCKPLATPIRVSRPVDTDTMPFADLTHFRSLVEALHYLTIARPALSFDVNQLCLHIHVPSVLLLSSNLISWICWK